MFQHHSTVLQSHSPRLDPPVFCFTTTVSCWRCINHFRSHSFFTYRNTHTLLVFLHIIITLTHNLLFLNYYLSSIPSPLVGNSLSFLSFWLHSPYRLLHTVAPFNSMIQYIIYMYVQMETAHTQFLEKVAPFLIQPFGFY